jgi:hypothetical protein
MSVPANGNMLLVAGDDGYQISRSLRLRASASAYLNRTFGTPTNGKIWTFSTWFKLGNGTYGPGGNLLGTADNGGASGNYVQLGIDYSNGMMYINDYSSGTAIYVTSSNLLRDSSAWYHLMYVYDSTQATAANRIIYYINGVQVTSYSNTTYPSQNYNTYINNSGQVTYFGANYSGSARSFIGSYFADSYFIDGQALTPTSFGAFDAITGVWNPKKYTGTYGTNGFYLNFSDNSAATATTIGKDYSGNGNNWTPNNISVTAGTTYDSMVDSPTNYGTDTAGTGATARGNYAVLNPLDSSAVTVSNGNLRVTYPGSDAWRGIRGTMPVPKTGSWKWEVIPTTMTYSFIGLAMPSATLSTSGFTNTYVYAWYLDSGEIRYSDVNVATGATVSVNDVVEVRVNNATVSFYKNNTLQWTFTQLLTDITPDYFPVTWMFNGAVQNYNFGQQPFVYTVAGYKALCTQNLPTATINNGANHMAATLYTGTGASQNISNAVNGISFQPDLVWVKNRSSASTSHTLYNTNVGIGTFLQSNTTDSSFGNAGISPILSNGFTAYSTNSWNNASGQNYIAWQWKGGGTAVTNTAGSITSSVSANTTAGFSIVTYTGNGTSGATIGHGLGATASFIILKRSNGGSGYSWYVQHPTLGPTKALFLDSTNGAATNTNYWNNTAPTSTVFSVGNDTSLNASGGTYVAYCWSQISGYSAFITYTGNGSGDGPFVYCGFRPRYLMLKRYDAAGDPWWVIDSSRSPYNQTTLALRPSAANAEDSGGNANFDFLANGFKARTSGGGNGNESGATYIVAAFAENPFTLVRAR